MAGDSSAGGWMQGLAPLVQNLSNIAGTGNRAMDAAARMDLEYSQAKARSIPALEMASRIEGAKSAGLHPLAALGVNVGSYSSNVSGSGTGDLSNAMSSYSRHQDTSADRVNDAQVNLLNQQARQAKAQADITEQQARASTLRLAGQAGNGPYVQLEPNKVIATTPSAPMQAQGVNPSQEAYSVPDYWTGEPINVDMPSEKFGQVMENSGEIAAAIMAAPYVAKSLFAQYLQTPLNAAKRNSELYQIFKDGSLRRLLAPKLHYQQERR